MKVCGANLRNKPGQTCRQKPMKGKERCKLHGGLSLAGPAHPAFTHGRHSKYLQLNLGERYNEARNDPRLIELRDEVALVDVRIGQLLEAIGETGNARLWKEARAQFDAFKRQAGKGKDSVAGARVALEQLDAILAQGQTQAATWDELADRLDLRRRLVESEVKRQKDLFQMITADQAMRMMGLLIDVVKTHVKDPELNAALSAEFVRVVGLGSGEATGTRAGGAVSGGVLAGRRPE